MKNDPRSKTADAERKITRTDRVAKALQKARQAKPSGGRARRAMRELGRSGDDVGERALNWLELIYCVTNGLIPATEALGLSASDGEQFARLGAHHLQHGNLDEALAAGKLAVAAAPKLAIAWHLLGDALAQKRKDVEALVALQQARDLDPKNVRVWVDIAEVHISRIEYAAAIAALKKARELDADGKTPAGRRAQMLIMQTLMTLEDQ